MIGGMTADHEEGSVCHACNALIEGEPAGRGCLVWSRGPEDVRYEELPLCERCALAISMTALFRWEIEEEEG
jgi:hypothetical protein